MALYESMLYEIHRLYEYELYLFAFEKEILPKGVTTIYYKKYKFPIILKFIFI